MAVSSACSADKDPRPHPQLGKGWSCGGREGSGAAELRGGWGAGWSKDEGLPCPLSSRPPSSLEAAVCWSGKASWESQHRDILGGLRGRRYRGGWALPLEATPLARWACAPSKKSPMGMDAQQEEQSLLRVRGGRCPPGMGGASRSQGGVSARLRGRVGALSQPGEGPRPRRGGRRPVPWSGQKPHLRSSS